MGYKTVSIEKILVEVIDQRLKENLTDIYRHLEMMNNLTSMTIA